MMQVYGHELRIWRHNSKNFREIEETGNEKCCKNYQFRVEVQGPNTAQSSQVEQSSSFRDYLRP